MQSSAESQEGLPSAQWELEHRQNATLQCIAACRAPPDAIFEDPDPPTNYDDNRAGGPIRENGKHAKYIVAAGGKGALHILTYENNLLKSRQFFKENVNAIAWRPEGRDMFVAASAGKGIGGGGSSLTLVIRKKNTATWEAPARWAQNFRNVHSLTWPRGRNTVICGYSDGFVKLYDLETATNIVATYPRDASNFQNACDNAPMTELHSKSRAVRDLDARPCSGGLTVLAAYESGVVKLVDVRAPFHKVSSMMEILVSSDSVSSARFHPTDAFSLLTASRHQHISWWDLRKTHRPVSTVRLASPVKAVRWRPGYSTQFAACVSGIDNRASLWDFHLSPHYPIGSFSLSDSNAHSQHRDLVWLDSDTLGASTDRAVTIHDVANAKGGTGAIRTSSMSFAPWTSTAGDTSCMDTMSMLYHSFQGEDSTLDLFGSSGVLPYWNVGTGKGRAMLQIDAQGKSCCLSSKNQNEIQTCLVMNDAGSKFVSSNEFFNDNANANNDFKTIFKNNRNILENRSNINTRSYDTINGVVCRPTEFQNNVNKSPRSTIQAVTVNNLLRMNVPVGALSSSLSLSPSLPSPPVFQSITSLSNPQQIAYLACQLRSADRKALILSSSARREAYRRLKYMPFRSILASTPPARTLPSEFLVRSSVLARSLGLYTLGEQIAVQQSLLPRSINLLECRDPIGVASGDYIGACGVCLDPLRLQGDFPSLQDLLALPNSIIAVNNNNSDGTPEKNGNINNQIIQESSSSGAQLAASFSVNPNALSSIISKSRSTQIRQIRLIGNSSLHRATVGGSLYHSSLLAPSFGIKQPYNHRQKTVTPALTTRLGLLTSIGLVPSAISLLNAPINILMTNTIGMARRCFMLLLLSSSRISSSFSPSSTTNAFPSMNDLKASCEMMFTIVGASAGNQFTHAQSLHCSIAERFSCIAPVNLRKFLHSRMVLSSTSQTSTGSVFDTDAWRFSGSSFQDSEAEHLGFNQQQQSLLRGTLRTNPRTNNNNCKGSVIGGESLINMSNNQYNNTSHNINNLSFSKGTTTPSKLSPIFWRALFIELTQCAPLVIIRLGGVDALIKAVQRGLFKGPRDAPDWRRLRTSGSKRGWNSTGQNISQNSAANISIVNNANNPTVVTGSRLSLISGASSKEMEFVRTLACKWVISFILGDNVDQKVSPLLGSELSYYEVYKELEETAESLAQIEYRTFYMGCVTNPNNNTNSTADNIKTEAPLTNDPSSTNNPEGGARNTNASKTRCFSSSKLPSQHTERPISYVLSLPERCHALSNLNEIAEDSYMAALYRLFGLLSDSRLLTSHAIPGALAPSLFSIYQTLQDSFLRIHSLRHSNTFNNNSNNNSNNERNHQALRVHPLLLNHPVVSPFSLLQNASAVPHNQIVHNPLRYRQRGLLRPRVAMHDLSVAPSVHHESHLNCSSSSSSSSNSDSEDTIFSENNIINDSNIHNHGVIHGQSSRMKHSDILDAALHQKVYPRELYISKQNVSSISPSICGNKMISPKEGNDLSSHESGILLNPYRAGIEGLFHGGLRGKGDFGCEEGIIEDANEDDGELDFAKSENCNVESSVLCQHLRLHSNNTINHYFPTNNNSHTHRDRRKRPSMASAASSASEDPSTHIEASRHPFPIITNNPSALNSNNVNSNRTHANQLSRTNSNLSPQPAINPISANILNSNYNNNHYPSSHSAAVPMPIEYAPSSKASVWDEPPNIISNNVFNANINNNNINNNNNFNSNIISILSGSSMQDVQPTENSLIEWSFRSPFVGQSNPSEEAAVSVLIVLKQLASTLNNNVNNSNNNTNNSAFPNEDKGNGNLQNLVIKDDSDPLNNNGIANEKIIDDDLISQHIQQKEQQFKFEDIASILAPQLPLPQLRVLQLHHRDLMEARRSAGLFAQALSRLRERNEVWSVLSLIFNIHGCKMIQADPALDRQIVRFAQSTIGLLRRFKLFTQSAEFLKYFPYEGVRSMGRMHPTFVFKCPSEGCGQLLTNGVRDQDSCNHCLRARAQCSICDGPVQGRWLSCPGCLHGGHAEHLSAWFAVNSGCACCGHECWKFFHSHELFHSGKQSVQ